MYYFVSGQKLMTLRNSTFIMPELSQQFPVSKNQREIILVPSNLKYLGFITVNCFSIQASSYTEALPAIPHKGHPVISTSKIALSWVSVMLSVKPD